MLNDADGGRQDLADARAALRLALMRMPAERRACHALKLAATLIEDVAYDLAGTVASQKIATLIRLSSEADRALVELPCNKSDGKSAGDAAMVADHGTAVPAREAGWVCCASDDGRTPFRLGDVSGKRAH